MTSPTPQQPATDTARPAGRWWWLGPLVVVIAALVLQWVWVEARQRSQQTGEASWIWIGHTTRWTGARAFYAFRDFDLEAVPEQAAVVTQGDEEYILYLNGQRVGSNRYVPGAPPDRYDVGDLLVVGTNRIVAHLRSSHGFGAFLLTLEAEGSDRPIVVTDGDWQISTAYFRRLFRPDLELAGRFDAVVVGRPPFGRWGALGEAVDRPVHSELRADYRPVPPRRAAVSDRGWRRLGQRRGGRELDLTQQVLLDWGGAVDGYLTLEMPEEQPIVGLVYLGLTRPDPVRNPPDAYVIWTPRQSYWEDAVPRRFRFALLIGAAGASDPRVVVTRASAIEPVVAGTRVPGVFGRPAPRLASPLEDEVWRELERFPRHPER